ncbi:glutathione S-transferase family protein [Leptospira vanthielii]|uniref:Glutathione S-transferase family protein n=2 Tax=Leptospira vanthielii TaxID=293085 RepID=A0ABY2NPT1_9LEPT|nr:glutathione S-transferase family protein [Leptospira vanthielii]EMY71926.1 glutathione S-transferase [Leptospira vanthielii serovar Holland str. Waz Holland = ATCC 700522]TGM56926.1 glutathione S-transferase family protein [Leptospira vanthielii]
MYQLYSNSRSPYSKRVHIYLQYRKIPYETVTVALEKLENRKKPFIQINPYGKVPVLNDDGFYLAESSAILRYLEEKHSFDPPFFSKNIQSRGLLNQAINRCESEFCFPGSVLYFAKKFVPEEKWDKNRMKDSSKRIGRHLDVLEGILESNDYLHENQFGFLEILYAPFLKQIELMDIKVPPHVEGWIKRVLAEPSVFSALEN